MANKIVLISEDTDFFDYIITKLELRKSDELFSFSFDKILNNLHQISTSVLIINSEGAQDKTIELIKLLQGTPIIVCAYNNDDDNYRKKCYRTGAFDFLSILIPDSEFRARLIPAFTVSDLLKKNENYRKTLVDKQVISQNNEVYIEYDRILEQNLKTIKEKSLKAVFMAISPNEKNKFFMQANQIETIILNNIRLNDILMNYAPNKYFLILFDTDIKSVEKLWNKISSQFSEKIYAGFTAITNQTRQQLINEVLNKLHLAINNDKYGNEANFIPTNKLNNSSTTSSYTNFKMFKQEFEKKLNNIIIPVFYHIQQKYIHRFSGITITHNIKDGCGEFVIKNSTTCCTFKITSPGFSKINFDITYYKNSNNIDSKRVTLEPEELEAGILEDLLEQFISEYKSEFNN